MAHAGRTRIVLTLGTAQTLAWASTYYLPAILAAPIATELGISVATVFAAFSVGLAFLHFWARMLAAPLTDLAGVRCWHRPTWSLLRA